MHEREIERQRFLAGDGHTQTQPDRHQPTPAQRKEEEDDAEEAVDIE